MRTRATTRTSGSALLTGARSCSRPRSRRSAIARPTDPDLGGGDPRRTGRRALRRSRRRAGLLRVLSCGICGKATIEAAFARRAGQRAPSSERSVLVVRRPLRVEQSAFDATGGIHAVGSSTQAARGSSCAGRRRTTPSTRLSWRGRAQGRTRRHRPAGVGARRLRIVQKAAAFGIPWWPGSAPTSSR
jgi:hypothetical protein